MCVFARWEKSRLMSDLDSEDWTILNQFFKAALFTVPEELRYRADQIEAHFGPHLIMAPGVRSGSPE